MKRVVLVVTTLTVGIVSGLVIGVRMKTVPATQSPMSMTHAGPTLEAVQSLASLVITKVTVSDVQIASLQGYTGSAKAALLVRGDFTIGTDLSQARFSDIDDTARSVVVTMERPTPGSPRVDLGRTRLVTLSTDGVWVVIPGHAAEEAVASEAFRAAQAAVLQISREPRWQEQAQLQAESVLRAFFGSVGWNVSVEWRGDVPQFAARAGSVGRSTSPRPQFWRPP